MSLHTAVQKQQIIYRMCGKRSDKRFDLHQLVSSVTLSTPILMGIPWKKWESGTPIPESVAHCKVQRHSAVRCAKLAETTEMPFGIWTRVGPWNHVLDRARAQFLWERTSWDMLNDTLPWAVQKQLNRSRCRLGSGLWWAQGNAKYDIWQTRLPSVWKWWWHLAVHTTCRQKKCVGSSCRSDSGSQCTACIVQHQTVCANSAQTSVMTD